MSQAPKGMPSFAEILSSASGVATSSVSRVFGYIIWWGWKKEVETTSLSWTDFYALWEQRLGLPMSCVPSQPGNGRAFTRAMRNFSYDVGMGSLKTLKAVRHTDHPDEKIYIVGYISTTEEESEAHAHFTELVRCTWKSTYINPRYVRVDPAANAIPDSSYQAIESYVSLAYQNALYLIEKVDLRYALLALINEYHGFPIREAGGVYWVPRGTSESQTEALFNTLTALDRDIDMLDMTILPVLQTEGSVETITEGVTNMMSTAITKLQAEATDFRRRSNEGNPPRESSIRRRMELSAHLGETLDHYRRILRSSGSETPGWESSLREQLSTATLSMQSFIT